MKIMRHHVVTSEGSNFFINEEYKAKRFAEKTNGKYLGLVEVPKDHLPTCLKK